MSNDLITSEEIKTLRAGAKTITPEMVMEAVAQGKIIPVVPLKINSGYTILMTIDMLYGRIAEHLSISRREGTDPADAEIIAKSVIGEGWIMKGSALNRNVIHFIKIVEE